VQVPEANMQGMQGEGMQSQASAPLLCDVQDEAGSETGTGAEIGNVVDTGGGEEDEAAAAEEEEAARKEEELAATEEEEAAAIAAAEEEETAAAEEEMNASYQMMNDGIQA
jgi:hypothetical protein